MMKKIITILSLIILTIGCKSPKYTAETKSDLSKLCVYEFPYTSKPIKIERDTIVINNVTIARDSIDCTDKDGIQYIEVKVPNDTIVITEIQTVDNPAQGFYILDLEFKNEKLEESVKEYKKYKNKYMRLWGLVLLIIAMWVINFIRRR